MAKGRGQKASDIRREKRVISFLGKFDSEDEAAGFDWSGRGLKRPHDIAAMIQLNSDTRLNMNLVRRKVSEGGRWYLLYRVPVKGLRSRIDEVVSPRGEEDLSDPIVVASDLEVLDGRHRVEAARSKGVKFLPAWIPVRLLWRLNYC